MFNHMHVREAEQGLLVIMLFCDAGQSAFARRSMEQVRPLGRMSNMCTLMLQDFRHRNRS